MQPLLSSRGEDGHPASPGPLTAASLFPLPLAAALRTHLSPFSQSCPGIWGWRLIGNEYRVKPRVTTRQLVKIMQTPTQGHRTSFLNSSLYCQPIALGTQEAEILGQLEHKRARTHLKSEQTRPGEIPHRMKSQIQISKTHIKWGTRAHICDPSCSYSQMGSKKQSHQKIKGQLVLNKVESEDQELRLSSDFWECTKYAPRHTHTHSLKPQQNHPVVSSMASCCS